jgi:hypothetical protein
MKKFMFYLFMMAFGATMVVGCGGEEKKPESQSELTDTKWIGLQDRSEYANEDHVVIVKFFYFNWENQIMTCKYRINSADSYYSIEGYCSDDPNEYYLPIYSYSNSKVESLDGLPNFSGTINGDRMDGVYSDYDGTFSIVFVKQKDIPKNLAGTKWVSPSGTSITFDDNVSNSTCSVSTGSHVYRYVYDEHAACIVIGSDMDVLRGYVNSNTMTLIDYYAKKEVFTKEGTSPSGISAPANVSATKSGNSILVTWSAVSDATSYKVYRSSTASGTYTQVGSPTAASYTDNSPLSGDNYYKVTAVKDSEESAQSSYALCNFTTGSSGGEGNVYVGVMGFHGALMPLAITNNLSSAKTFISNLQNNQDYTSLCYAVEKSVPMFAASGLPSFDKTFVVSFTDGRDNNSANLWDFNEHITVADVYAKAQTALLAKAGLRSYAIGLGSQISASEMQQLVVNGGEYKAATSSSLNSMFTAVANSVLASSKNLVLKTRYSPTTKQFRLTIKASQTSGGSVVSDQIVCKIDPQGSGFVMTIVTPGTYASFDAPVNVTVVNPESPSRTFEVPLNNLKYVRNNTEYIVGDITVEAKTSSDWYTDTEDKVEESSVQKKIAVVLVLDCSTSLGSDFPTLKTSANNFIDILGQK